MAKTATAASKTAGRKTAAKAPTAAAKSVMKELDKSKGTTQAPATPQGEGASATPPQAPHIDLQRYVDALSQASGFSKASVDLEVAVCLSIFAEAGEADVKAKREVMKAYVGAGWKCAAHTEADYKTVSRRLNAAAALFARMGGKKAIDEVTAGVPVDAHIGAIVNHLASKYELTSLNAVWAAAGRPVKNVRDWTYDERTRGENTPPQRSRTPASAEGATATPPAGVQDTTNATVLTHGRLQLVIPNDCPEQDLMDMLAELMSFVHERQGAGAGAQTEQPKQAAQRPATKQARTTH